MKPYPKIKTIWERDPETKYKTLIEGQWATPIFDLLQYINWVMYEKIDGTNIRAIYDPLEDAVEFRGRTDKAQIPPFLLGVLQKSITPDSFKSVFDLERSGDAMLTLYGEGFGNRIQKIGKQYGNPQFCLFDIMVGDIWMEQSFVTEAAEIMELQRAPVYDSGSLWDAIAYMQGGFSKSAWGDFALEGLVLRPEIDLYGRMGHRIISKIKHKDFPAQ